jgi:hypothetical protein
MNVRTLGNDFHQTPTRTLERMELVFENLGERILNYKLAELFFSHEGARTAIPLAPTAGGYIHARQQMTYGFDVKGFTFKTFPLILILGFRVEYDNVPPVRRRRTKRIIQYTFNSFKPMIWSNTILEQDEYWSE